MADITNVVSYERCFDHHHTSMTCGDSGPWMCGKQGHIASRFDKKPAIAIISQRKSGQYFTITKKPNGWRTTNGLHRDIYEAEKEIHEFFEKVSSSS